MEKKTTGLSREMIIHPCETLKEMIENKTMPQNELAQRTGVSAKHISTIISGEKNITPSFAKKLEYVFGVSASFWMNLQVQHDTELQEFEELNSINKEEHVIAKKLKEVITWLKEKEIIFQDTFGSSLILELRKVLGVSNLSAIQTFTFTGAFRAQTKKKVDTEILFAWQKICELSAENSTVQSCSEKTQAETLKKIIPQLKKCMFLTQEEFMPKLNDLFAGCGIAFCVVPFFTGAPVQGFIKKTENEKILLCMTFRQRNAGIFWFTLFHEIGHILNGDVKNSFVDFESVESDIEKKADTFAQNQLVDSKKYSQFIEQADFTLTAISTFAKEQGVPPFIVIGRLQHDNILHYSDFHDEVVMYEGV